MGSAKYWWPRMSSKYRGDGCWWTYASVNGAGLFILIDVGKAGGVTRSTVYWGELRCICRGSKHPLVTAKSHSYNQRFPLEIFPPIYLNSIWYWFLTISTCTYNEKIHSAKRDEQKKLIFWVMYKLHTPSCVVYAGFIQKMLHGCKFLTHHNKLYTTSI
jgi:hypothetical protein